MVAPRKAQRKHREISPACTLERQDAAEDARQHWMPAAAPYEQSSYITGIFMKGGVEMMISRREAIRWQCEFAPYLLAYTHH